MAASEQVDERIFQVAHERSETVGAETDVGVSEAVGESSRVNGLDTQALQEAVDAISAEPNKGASTFRARTTWNGRLRTTSTIDDWFLGGERIPQSYSIDIDEPSELLGEDSAPNPQMVLQAAMNACMLNTFVAAASVMGVELRSVEFESRGDIDLRGFLGIDESIPAGYRRLDVTIRVEGDGTPEQYDKMLELVRRQSPNYHTISNPVELRLEIEQH